MFVGLIIPVRQEEHWARQLGAVHYGSEGDALILPSLLLDLSVYVQFVLQVEEDIEVELVPAMLSGSARQIGLSVDRIRSSFQGCFIHSQEAIAMPTLRHFQLVCEALEQRPLPGAAACPSAE